MRTWVLLAAAVLASGCVAVASEPSSGDATYWASMPTPPPTPVPIGTRINGSMVDVQLVQGHEAAGGAWNWSARAWFHDAERPLTVLFLFRPTQKGSRAGFSQDESGVERSWEGTNYLPMSGRPVRAIVGDPVTGKVIDSDSFAWTF